MNVYDFDGTLYEGDSSVDFYRYNLKRKPWLCVLWPVQLAAAIGYKLRIIGKTRMKEVFYLYFRMIDAEAEAGEFWKKNIEKVYPWYYEAHREDDVVISASPEFFLKYPCAHLGISNLLASRVDPETGKTEGLNCHGEEKLARFRAAFPDARVEQAYFDRKSDLPVSLLADRLMLVHHYGYVREVERDELPESWQAYVPKQG